MCIVSPGDGLKEEMGRQMLIPSNGLVLGALDSQSLGPGKGGSKGGLEWAVVPPQGYHIG